jgi:hypothetical protein
MTTTEFNHEFDILYNGIAKNDAPPIDLYEKSVYLTKAQLEIIKNYFDPKSNKKGQGFEQSSKRRTDLNELIRSYRTTLKLEMNEGLVEESQFFRIPDNTFLIIQERAKVSSDNKCIDETYLKVIPKTHDEFEVQINNPFKKPNDKIIWRLDFYSHSGGSKNIELISPYSIVEYKSRYIKYPSPIVLTDLLSAFPNETLTIDGVSQEKNCELNQSVHREILDRAVELALSDYKPELVQLKAQLNTRNE